MSSYEVLLHPTYPTDGQSTFTKQDAVSLGSLLLKKNGMSDMEAYEEDTTETSSYFLCSYRNILEPSLAHGGGAVLVVRKQDFLCGMVHCRSNWLKPDEFDMIAQIGNAYEKYDGSSKKGNA